MNAEIGARLRAARQAQDLSLRSLAQSVGVSASLLSQVENGRTQPSVSTLYALVTRLNVSLDDLLGASGAPVPPTEPASAAVQRGAENPVLQMENGVRWEHLAVSDGGPADLLLVTYAPGAASSLDGKFMRHLGVEFAYLLEGELTVQIDFDTHVVGPGDSLRFDSVRPHLYSNRGAVPARGVWFVTGRRAATREGAEATRTAADPATPLQSAVDVLRALDPR